jgi:hypothetical protein
MASVGVAAGVVTTALLEPDSPAVTESGLLPPPPPPPQAASEVQIKVEIMRKVIVLYGIVMLISSEFRNVFATSGSSLSACGINESYAAAIDCTQEKHFFCMSFGN